MLSLAGTEAHFHISLMSPPPPRPGSRPSLISFNRPPKRNISLPHKRLSPPVTTLERKAIKARNKMIHSRVTASGQEQIKDYTLFHRLMLRSFPGYMELFS